MPAILTTRTLLLLSFALSASTALADEPAKPATTYDKAEVDRAVDRGLAYLASVQLTEKLARQVKHTRTIYKPNANRNRPATEEKVTETFELPDLAGTIAVNTPGSTGITSLALMAFLSKGHVPGRGPYGEVLNRGIDYLLAQPRFDGKKHDGFLICRHKIGQASGRGSGMMYEHLMTTLLLTEVSGMVDAERQEKLDKVLARAIEIILDAQKSKKSDPLAVGGWRYSPTSDSSDISLSGWAFQALRAAKLNGANVPDAAIEDATKFLLNCHDPVTGGFTYSPGHGPGFGRTGIGILCLTLSGKSDDKYIQPAARYLAANIPSQFMSNNHYLYEYYYASQAAFQLGPEYWEQFAPRMHALILPAQRSDGSWPPAEGLASGSCGPVYTTSLALLSLTPPYQQLPIYQRVESRD